MEVERIISIIFGIILIFGVSQTDIFWAKVMFGVIGGLLIITGTVLTKPSRLTEGDSK